MNANPHRFYDLHTHGFIRVVAATPKVRTADISFNRDAIMEEARRAHDAQADLVIFPELCLSSYALDDLVLQGSLLDAVETALLDILRASADLSPVLVAGAPLRHNGKLFNCAVVIAGGKILGVVPKSYLPNYREYYEKRWYAHGRGVSGTLCLAGQEAVPFGSDLIFAADNIPGFRLFVEICEDYWSPLPPSTRGALAGATILVNLSASNITIGKADERTMLARAQSARAIAAYVYSSAGHGESTTDLAWDGQGMIFELGDELASSERFSDAPALCIADIDCDRILAERLRNQTFADCAEYEGRPEDNFRTIG
ncbi:MAG: nitrilase-related carbon-nitrogen hydrolase, partial [Sphingomonadaceae bacterium]